MKRLIILLLAALVVTLCWAAQTKIGQYHVEVATQPSPIPVGRANLIITIKDAAGKPVDGATVSAIVAMPGMNMGEREQVARAGTKSGEYVASAVFAMAGLYEATITINGQKGVVELRTGEASRGSASFPWTTAVAIAAAACVVAFTLYRVRKTGQRFSLRSIFNVPVIASVVLLGVTLAGVVWVVNNLRRPGSMTPIESQAMEMNTPAPEGTLPVLLAKAEDKSLDESVTYSGQAIGFVEQDIVPRVAGTIISMPVYVGDRVRRGQLLAQLDTSQIDPEVAMRGAQLDRANQSVGVASLEYQSAVNAVAQASAERAMAQGEVAEAEAMLRAAEESRAAAVAEIQGTDSEVAAMEAELSAAEADRDYLKAEFGRAQQLFAKGAVSKDELQKAKAEAERAEAMVRRASENIGRARAARTSARAMQRKVEAEISAATRKIQVSQASLRAKEAMVKTAQSKAETAKAQIGKERAMVAESAAGLRGAATQRSYSKLYAETDGVVTQRLIDPGQVVSPGQAVLRVAQVSPIRLQANVPESILPRIKVGTTVRVSTDAGKGASVVLSVTSVAPSLDPNVRTGVVEAISDNSDGAFRPGQFVTMQIVIGQSMNGVVVPRAAIIRESTSDTPTADGMTKAYVWVAEPGMNGEHDVKRQEVAVMAQSGGEASITGIQAGQLVIVNPPQGLREGTRVVSTSTPESSEHPVVIVTERGYEPASISIPANKPVTITFIRKVDPSCTDVLQFPTLKIKKNLPFNEPVDVQIPAQKPGEIKFACGMNMYTGKVVVR